jgi:hypothetical protein
MPRVGWRPFHAELSRSVHTGGALGDDAPNTGAEDRSRQSDYCRSDALGAGRGYGRLATASCDFTQQLAESYLTVDLYRQILRRIERLAFHRGSRQQPEESLNRILGSDDAHEHTAADGTCAATMTSVNVSQMKRELSDGLIRPFSATTAGRKRSTLEIPDQSFNVVSEFQGFGPPAGYR